MTMMPNEDIDQGEGAMHYPFEGTGGPWRPQCWTKSPEQLQEEARMLNNAAFASAAAAAGKHDNPPIQEWERDT
jgi:hypothetical protein